MKNKVLELARKLRLIYEQGSQEHFSLFMGSFEFPTNSCEGASRVFAHLVTKKYPTCTVKVVKGYSYQTNEWHFWTLVDELIYDLTIDQFDGFSTPIFAASSTPLAKKYNDLEFIGGEHIFQNWSPGGRYDKLKTLDYVEQRLAYI